MREARRLPWHLPRGQHHRERVGRYTTTAHSRRSGDGSRATSTGAADRVGRSRSRRTPGRLRGPRELLPAGRGRAGRTPRAGSPEDQRPHGRARASSSIACEIATSTSRRITRDCRGGACASRSSAYTDEARVDRLLLRPARPPGPAATPDSLRRAPGRSGRRRAASYRRRPEDGARRPGKPKRDSQARISCGSGRSGGPARRSRGGVARVRHGLAPLTRRTLAPDASCDATRRIGPCSLTRRGGLRRSGRGIA